MGEPVRTLMYSGSRVRPTSNQTPVRIYIIRSYVASKRTDQRFSDLTKKIQLLSQGPVLTAEDEEEFHVNCNFNTAAIQPNGDLTFLGDNPGGKSLVVVPTADSREQDELDTYNHGVPANILGAVLKSNFQAFFCQGGDIYLKFRWDNQPKKFKQAKFLDKMADFTEAKQVLAVNGNYTYMPGLLVFISLDPESSERSVMFFDIQTITKTYEKQLTAKNTAVVKFKPIRVEGTEGPRFVGSLYNQLFVGSEGNVVRKFEATRDSIDLTGVLLVEGDITYITPLTLGRLLVFHKTESSPKPWTNMFRRPNLAVSLFDRMSQFQGTMDLYDSTSFI